MIQPKQLAEYIQRKIPWGEGQTGPDSFDCQGWVIYVSEKYYNNKLPNVEVNAKSLLDIVKKISKHKVWEQFQTICSPEDGCIVKMVTAENPSHIGIYVNVDSGGVTHCLKESGVIFDDMFTLRATYHQISFHKFIGE